jgi:hypothetical protein
VGSNGFFPLAHKGRGWVLLTLLFCFSALAIGLVSPFAVTEEPSYAQAVARWPDMQRPIAFLGLKDHPDEFSIMWNGNIGANSLTRTDADRNLFREKRENSLQVSFSVGERPNYDNRNSEDPSTAPSLLEGSLPVTSVRLRANDVVLLQEAFVTGEQGGGTAAWDAPVFLRVRFTVEQAGTGSSPIRLWAQLAKNNTSYAMTTRRNVRIARIAPLYGETLHAEKGDLLNKRGLVVLSADQGLLFSPQIPEALSSISLRETQMDQNLCQFSIARNAGAVLDLILPFGPVSAEKMASHRRLGFEKARQSVISFWKGEIARGMQVETPEKPLNELWRFSVPISFMTADAYPNGDRVLKTSSHHYEAYWPTPMAMNLQELIQRGYRAEASAYLLPFLDPDRRRPVPNTGFSFLSTKGFISGPTEHLLISWVGDHGAILWIASEYFLLTRDRQFLDRWLPVMLDGLEWIAREREHTRMIGGIGAGLMPAGRATDADRQANFVWSDAWIYRGLDGVCRVLRSINHKDTARWEAERNDYKVSFQKAFRQVIQNSIRWTDASGKSIPFVPYELSQQDANSLHPFYLDTGPMILGVAGLVEPGDESMTWAMRWLTEGPDSRSHNPDWSDFFDRPSLPFEMSSCEPCYSWNIPLRFLRNEKAKYLEGFYSLCAGSVSRKFRGGSETRDGVQWLPVMNSVINIHLRNMLVFEDEPARGLHLLRNSPGAWLEPVKKVCVERAETYFGPISYTVETLDNKILASVQSPEREPVEWIRMHLSLPQARKVLRATVNGSPVRLVDGEVLEISRPSGNLKIVAEF